jgi:hypothetical protein
MSTSNIFHSKESTLRVTSLQTESLYVPRHEVLVVGSLVSDGAEFFSRSTAVEKLIRRVVKFQAAIGRPLCKIVIMPGTIIHCLNLFVMIPERLSTLILGMTP